MKLSISLNFVILVLFLCHQILFVMDFAIFGDQPEVSRGYDFYRVGGQDLTMPHVCVLRRKEHGSVGGDASKAEAGAKREEAVGSVLEFGSSDDGSTSSMNAIGFQLGVVPSAGPKDSTSPRLASPLRLGTDRYQVQDQRILPRPTSPALYGSGQTALRRNSDWRPLNRWHRGSDNQNLSDGIDNVALQDMFRKFGNVLSCKVAMFEDGKSKGYGFVQFETEESTLAATNKLNGFTVADKQLCDDVQEKHRVIGSGAMDEYKNDNGLLCGTSEL
ncbi:hypothetical protein ACLB2K_007507 [Fragaria x ananassa]